MPSGSSRSAVDVGLADGEGHDRRGQTNRQQHQQHSGRARGVAPHQPTTGQEDTERNQAADVVDVQLADALTLIEKFDAKQGLADQRDLAARNDHRVPTDDACPRRTSHINITSAISSTARVSAPHQRWAAELMMKLSMTPSPMSWANTPATLPHPPRTL